MANVWVWQAIPVSPGRWRVLVFLVGMPAGIAGFSWLAGRGAREIPRHEAATRAIVDQVKRFHPDGAALPEARIRKTLSEGRVVPDDPYSVVLNEETARETFGGDPDRPGIGVALARTGNGIGILSVFPGSPAEQEGLRPGDRITAIDGRPLGGIAAETAAARLLGEAGSIVTVAYWEARDSGDTLREKKIPRAVEDGTSCRARVVTEGVVAVRIDRFDGISVNGIPDAVRKAVGSPRGVILDLRDCGGNDVGAMVRAASLFLPGGTVIGTLEGPRFGPSGEPVVTGETGVFSDIPLAILVNRRTASAAEFLAGSLQALGRAKLVGEPTFGKGTIQERFPIPGGTLLLTTGRFYLPGGGRIDPSGVIPDLAVSIEGDGIPDPVLGLLGGK